MFVNFELSLMTPASETRNWLNAFDKLTFYTKKLCAAVVDEACPVNLLELLIVAHCDTHETDYDNESKVISKLSKYTQIPKFMAPLGLWV